MLKRKKAILVKDTGNTNLITKFEAVTGVRTFAQVAKEYLSRPFYLLLFDPVCVFCSFIFSVIYGILYLLFTTIGELYSTKYNFTVGETGLIFIAVGIGSASGTVIGGKMLDYTYRLMKKRYQSEGRAEFVSVNLIRNRDNLNLLYSVYPYNFLRIS